MLCDVFDIFRIDHVLGFYRIYSFPWRPQRNAEFLPLTLDEAAARTGGHRRCRYPRNHPSMSHRLHGRRLQESCGVRQNRAGQLSRSSMRLRLLAWRRSDDAYGVAHG